MDSMPLGCSAWFLEHKPESPPISPRSPSALAATTPIQSVADGMSNLFQREGSTEKHAQDVAPTLELPDSTDDKFMNPDLAPYEPPVWTPHPATQPPTEETLPTNASDITVAPDIDAVARAWQLEQAGFLAAPTLQEATLPFPMEVPAPPVAQPNQPSTSQPATVPVSKADTATAATQVHPSSLNLHNHIKPEVHTQLIQTDWFRQADRHRLMGQTWNGQTQT
jgi:hypothetical protein